MSSTARKLLSQNFLWNRELVSKLIRGSSISRNDHVLEIGAGQGIITEQLLGVCRRLTAFETDQQLITYLNKKFSALSNLNLLAGDFLARQLPRAAPFKVFSNIPFSITGEIVKKLLFSANPPVDCYLVVQKEAAEKILPNKDHNSMLAILFYPWFIIRTVHHFQKTDFKPAPGVETQLLRIEKRPSPLIADTFLSLYRDFIVYFFTKDRSATSRSPEEWLNRFRLFLKDNDQRAIYRIKGSFVKWQAEERKLVKIHRTRTDIGWAN